MRLTKKAFSMIDGNRSPVQDRLMKHDNQQGAGNAKWIACMVRTGVTLLSIATRHGINGGKTIQVCTT